MKNEGGGKKCVILRIRSHLVMAAKCLQLLRRFSAQCATSARLVGAPNAGEGRFG